MSTNRTIIGVALLVSAILLILYLQAAVDVNNAKNVLIPLLSGLVTAATFCFSFSFLVFNAAIQRYGGGSYDLLDKRQLFLLILEFFCSFSLVLLVNVATVTNIGCLILLLKVALLASLLFLVSIPAYFFWQVKRISSKALLERAFHHIGRAMNKKDAENCEDFMKTLFEVVSVIIDEHDGASFDFFLAGATDIQRKLLNMLESAPDDCFREDLKWIWSLFGTSMQAVLTGVSAENISSLRYVSYFYGERLKTVFRAETRSGSLLTIFSDDEVQHELELVYSFLWWLTRRIRGGETIVGARYVREFLEYMFISTEVSYYGEDKPDSILDYFYLYSKQHRAYAVLISILENDVNLYPFVKCFDKSVADNLSLSMKATAAVLYRNNVSKDVIRGIVEDQFRRDDRFSNEERQYRNDVLASLSKYLT